MTSNDFIELLVYFVVLIALDIPLGLYMAKVFQGEKTLMDKVMGPLKRIIYRICGIHAKAEMNWWEYALSRNLSEQKVQDLVEQFTEGRQFGFLGQPRVNVLKLNIALDSL